MSLKKSAVDGRMLYELISEIRENKLRYKAQSALMCLKNKATEIKATSNDSLMPISTSRNVLLKHPSRKANPIERDRGAA